MTKKILRDLCVVAFACVLLVPGGGDKAWGATVSLEQAHLLAENWLGCHHSSSRTRRPLAVEGHCPETCVGTAENENSGNRASGPIDKD